MPSAPRSMGGPASSRPPAVPRTPSGPPSQTPRPAGRVSRSRPTLRQLLLFAVHQRQPQWNAPGGLTADQTHLCLPARLVRQIADAEHLRLQPAADLVEQIRQRPIPRPLPRRPTRHPNPPQIRQVVPQRPSETSSSHLINRPTHSPPRYPVTPASARDPRSLPITHRLERAAPYRYVVDSMRGALCRRPSTVTVLSVLSRSPMLRSRKTPGIPRSAAPQRQPVPERSS